MVRPLPDSRYFELFGLEPRLDLDSKALEQRFFQLSRQWHPDLFARKPEAERQQALDRTAELNDAYRTLKHPVKRAEYLVGSDEKVVPPPELLEEVFELNMALESSDRPELELKAKDFTARLAEIDLSLASPSPNLDHKALRALLNRRKYLQNLVNEVQKALHA